ncbi:probable N-acetyltransferase camello isoform X2 [Lepisosteus oculatus]|nr:PREDICTED: probable N-acetyltransferase camello [Lepisosteus oculatus]XP_015199312.1 PREDICTED: probable N-acetyltransferase camello [Lepisosteus oculatus]XP_015199313.1 PREDICTED: probable N-acetyltransferase camello [Lepisosteus oculatus]
MASFQIRKYRDEDYETVKEIFTLGMSEHVPAAFVHLLKQPLPQMVLMCVFWALLASSKSLVFPVMAVTLLLAGARQGLNCMFSSYIEQCLREDLRDIRKSYMGGQDSCFWVAESEGGVAATVACCPSEREQGCLELKRMSVKKSHRGQGMAKALAQTVADFARARGYEAVLLGTSVVQYEAQKLYEGIGYKKTNETLVPNLVGKVTNFTIFEYRLDVLEREA